MAMSLFDMVKKEHGRFGASHPAVARARKKSQWAAPLAQARRAAPPAAPWPLRYPGAARSAVA
jgi:hypothetical protein